MPSEKMLRKYIYGGCHGLAFVLAKLSGKPIGILKARKADGKVIYDPLHVFVIQSPETILDIKGVRTRTEMELDFANITCEIENFAGFDYEIAEDPDELYYDMGFDPSVTVDAAEDLRSELWGDFAPFFPEYSSMPDFDIYEVEEEDDE